MGIFILGLLKKTLLADPMSPGVDEAFASPAALPLFAAWHAALSYSLQLYFDFSGYSDMAIGLARMFNVRLPVNFDSPYKACSVIEYWQRWHITLTRYLTRYIHDPLALRIMRRRMAHGRKVNHAAQTSLGGFLTMIAVPVTVTIGLAGIWHGSGAQFLVFGLLHAAFLVVNRAWRLFRPPRTKPLGFGVAWRVGLTYGCALTGSVFFRAASVPDALAMFGGMIGEHGVGPALPLPSWIAGYLPGSAWLIGNAWVRPAAWHSIIQTARDLLWLAALYAIVWGAPNTQQIFVAASPTLERVEPAAPAWLRWRPTVPWGLALGCLLALGLLSLGGTGEFLYFRF